MQFPYLVMTVLPNYSQTVLQGMYERENEKHFYM